MPKNKKNLDKDMMFQKIMPVLAGNPFSNLSAAEETSSSEELSALRARLSGTNGDSAAEHPMPKNAMEAAVDGVIDSVIRKFNCCPCDHCRREIAAIALNALPPKYHAGSEEEIQAVLQEIEHRDVYNVLIKAVLYVRSHPSH